MSLSALTIESIAKVIQLSVAPVFLLAGVGGTLSVLAARLVRIVDRARLTEGQLKDASDELVAELSERLAALALRGKLISRAMTFSVVCAVLVPLVVVSLFVSELFHVNLAVPIAVAFIVALVSLAIGLVYFLREVFVATAGLNFGASDGTISATQRLRGVLKRT